MTGTLELIEKEVPGMSKGHKAIGNFILASYDKAAYMTAAKLGEEVGVSESTAKRIKKSGVISKAISQKGRVIVTDVELARTLYAEACHGRKKISF